MDRAAADSRTGGKYAGVGVQAWEGGQQGGMDVDQPVVPALDEPRGEQAHEPGEAHQPSIRLLKGQVERAFESLVGPGRGDDR